MLGRVGVPIPFPVGCIVFGCLLSAWVDIRGMVCIQHAAAFVAWRDNPERCVFDGLLILACVIERFFAAPCKRTKDYVYL